MRLLGDEEPSGCRFVSGGADIPDGIEAADGCLWKTGGFIEMRDEGVQGFCEDLLRCRGAHGKQL